MKLNLGCGTDYRKDYVNVDFGNVQKDIDHDLEIFPYPFDTDSITEIIMQHSIEHICRTKFPMLVEELYRITISGALIIISAPYYLSRNAFTDFTHKNFMTEESFSYFDPDHALYQLGRNYGLKARFSVTSVLDGDRLGPITNIHYRLITLKN